MSSPVANATDVLRHLPLFDELNEYELEALNSYVQLKVIRKQGTVFQAGDLSDTVYFLIKGIIKIGTHSDDGREVIKHVLHPMAMFGELGMVGEQRRQDFAMAMNEEVKLYTIKVKHLQAMMRTNPLLSMKFLNLIGTRLRTVENRLESLIFKDARERIIDFLKDSATRQGKKIGYEMLIKHCLTQQDIANITGTSRQTVTSVLNDLRKSNLIYFNRRSILIRDMAKLS